MGGGVSLTSVYPDTSTIYEELILAARQSAVERNRDSSDASSWWWA